MIWSAGGKSLRRYRRLPEGGDIHDRGRAVTMLRDAVDETVRAQMPSDVAVNTFLSGGIDSSVVTAIAARNVDRAIRAFTLGFAEERSDKRSFAARAAAHVGAGPVVDVLTAAEADRAIDDAVEAYDEYFGIGAGLSMVAISRLAAGHGARAVLSGDGADELFVGYRHYDALHD